MKIQQFEDTEAWRKARVLVDAVHRLSSNGQWKNDWPLRDQIQRAAISVTANIAEGFDGQTDGDFIQFLVYSRRSASEVQSHLYLAYDRGYLSKADADRLQQQVLEVKRLINGFIRYLRTSKRSHASSA